MFSSGNSSSKSYKPQDREKRRRQTALFSVLNIIDAKRRKGVKREYSKRIDYSEMYAALDDAVAGAYSQMQMYARIGKAVASRKEKGAAVVAAEYLQEQCPDIPGFSPRNLRRMRDFYNAYSLDTEALSLAMQIGWTQNVVVLEAELTVQERIWYLKQIAVYGWSKKFLSRTFTMRFI